MNLIELVSTVCRRLGLTEPNSVVASNDKNIKQMSALLAQLGCDLTTQFDWRALYREHFFTTKAIKRTITTTEGSRTITLNDASAFDTKWLVMGAPLPPLSSVLEQISPTQLRMTEAATATGSFEVTFHQYVYALPQDWHRQVSQTEWNRNGQGPIAGPKTPQSWQQFKAGVVYPAVGSMFRLIGNSIQIMPPAPNGLTFSFEYISNNWVLSGSSTHPAFIDDTDSFIFSDSLLMTGLVARWFDVHGLDSTIEKGDFAALLQTAKAQDKSAPVLSISAKAGSRYISNNSVPDGNWGV